MIKRSKKSGFTLVELIIVIALVGVLAAIAAPSLNRFVKRSQSQGVASDVANRLRFARNLAMSRGEAISVRIRTTSEQTGGFMRIRRGNTDPPPTSCREVGNVALTEILNDYDHSLDGAVNDMQIQARSHNDSWLCFEPSGRMVRRGGIAHSTPNLCTGESFVFYLASGSVGGGLSCGLTNEIDARRENYWRVSVSYSGAIRVTDRNW